MSVTADLDRARALLHRQQSFDALAILERAFRDVPDDPEVRSLYGLVIALERGQVRASIDLCREAVASAPDRPELYANLAEVYLKAGQKQEAVATLRDGLAHVVGDASLAVALQRLGMRRAPVVRSLPRAHPINKYLGMAAARLGLR